VTSVIVYEEKDGTQIMVNYPLTDKVDMGKIVVDLPVPVYVNTEDFMMKKAVTVLWAAWHPHSSLRESLRPEVGNDTLPLLLFGGGAVKMLCPSANRTGSPFQRRIGDLDFITTWKAGSKAVRLLNSMSRVAGESFFFFTTKGDRTFNALRGGSRYRLRMLERVQEGVPSLKDVDIFTDEIELRHTIKFKHDFEVAKQNKYTVGPEKLLLSKLQVIMAVSRDKLDLLQFSGQQFRLLDYPRYGGPGLLVGMEEKDMLDVCSLLHDTAEDGPAGISLDKNKLSEYLRKDRRFALTCRLNLENLARRREWMSAKGLTEVQVNRVVNHARETLDAIPEVDKEWSRPWWNTDVETPLTS
jgi:hypothetical protein